MEYIYRALNDSDIVLLKCNKGLMNKEIIDECTYDSFKMLCLLSNEAQILNMSKRDFLGVYEDMKLALVQSESHQIVDKTIKRQEKIEHMILEFMKTGDGSQISSILATLQGHINTGKNKNTPWISFSKDLRAMKRYYIKQSQNKIAVVRSDIQEFFDISSEYGLIAYDLSSRDAIAENHFLINKPQYDIFNNPVFKYTDRSCRSFNYTISSKEVVYYNYVPPEKIVSVLGPFEADLLLNGILNIAFYDRNARYSNIMYHKLLLQLQECLKTAQEYDGCTRYLFEEHIKNGNPIFALAHTAEEIQELTKVKKKILYYVSKVENPLIMHKNLSNIHTMEGIN